MDRDRLRHFVFYFCSFPACGILKGDVQVPVVPRVRRTRNGAFYFFALGNYDRGRRVEHGLFPMRVLCMRSCRELSLLMCAVKCYVEPREKCVDV
jgi:hypothetical protein